METIEILWDEDEERYQYECPFCGELLVLPDDCFCDHVIFGFDGVNYRPLTYPPDWVVEFLKGKPFDYLEGMQELWNDDFDYFDEDEEPDPEELEERRTEAFDCYLEENISLEDILKILDEPEFKEKKQSMFLAEIEDVDMGTTSYLLAKE